jgi:hypothetical protein
MQFPRVPAMIDGTRQASNPAESPQQAIFEFRLRQSSEIHSFMFPHYPGVQLSGDYEFAVHLTALRPGWILLFSVNPDKRLTLLLPGDGGASQIPHLDAGQMVRFPSESAWEPITPNPGRRRFYAVYLDDVATARSLVAESRRADASEGGLAALRTKLDEMVVAGGCASSTRPCVLTFEYEVF